LVRFSSPVVLTVVPAVSVKSFCQNLIDLEQEEPMTRASTLSLLAVPVLVPLFGGLLARAAEQPPLPTGTMITVAGNGKAGFSGNGGPATQAALNNPLGLAVDTAGNLFIGDAYNARVRKVSPDGTITTVAGGGNPAGGLGDGGQALKARFAEANAVAVDAMGDLFVSDFGNNRVRMVSASGIITTVAGGGHPTHGLGDGGAATAATLNGPNQLAVDSTDNLYIADPHNNRIRKVDAAGIITTVAGGGHPADGRGDGGMAADARLLGPYGVAVDRAGNLYVGDFIDDRVRKVTADGKISTVAGGGNPADGLGDGGPATDARLDGPGWITVDAGGNLFIGDNRSERIRKVDSAGIITTVAGTGQIGYTGDRGPATAARLNSPVAVAVDRAGNLFFAEGNRYKADVSGVEKGGNNLVREVMAASVPG
jgi:sugar lactone lactonase YvrE